MVMPLYQRVWPRDSPNHRGHPNSSLEDSWLTIIDVHWMYHVYHRVACAGWIILWMYDINCTNYGLDSSYTSCDWCLDILGVPINTHKHYGWKFRFGMAGAGVCPWSTCQLAGGDRMPTNTCKHHVQLCCIYKSKKTNPMDVPSCGGWRHSSSQIHRNPTSWWEFIVPSGNLTQLWKITVFNGKTH